MLVQLYNSLFWWPFNYFSLINEFNVLIIILKFSIIKNKYDINKNDS